MKHIATGLLFDRDHKLLIYLRDDKPSIPFPGYWDLFGGHVEAGETAEEALVREIKEELDYDLGPYYHYRDYVIEEGDTFENTKHVYWAVIDKVAGELTLLEGQRLASISLSDRHQYNFANVLGKILDDFAKTNFPLDQKNLPT
ncbi:MAG: NUDIX domain-containing protein [Rhodothermales bacterium]